MAELACSAGRPLEIMTYVNKSAPQHRDSDVERVMKPVGITYRTQGDEVLQEVSIGSTSFEASRPLTEGSAAIDPSGAWWKSFLRGEPAQPHRRNGRLKYIDLFCASGGLSLGLEEAAGAVGLRTTSLLGMDLDRRALEVYEANHHPTFTSSASIAEAVDFHLTQGDVTDTQFVGSPMLLTPELAGSVGEVDVVLAGPPCQGHSSLNNATRHDDVRNKLYAFPAAIAIALGARAVVIENVPGVKRDRGSIFQRTEALLKNNGFAVDGLVIKAEQLGWPQTRHRYFLVAVKGGRREALHEVVDALSAEPRSVGWAIGDLLDVGAGSILDETPTLSEDNQRRIEWLHSNDAYDLDDSERPDCHRTKEHSYRSSYGRMRWDRPSGTLTTGFLTPGRGRFVHPLRPRVLTPREAARIQGFPDSYFAAALPGGPFKRTELAKWIGDAVPAPLGFAACLAATWQLAERKQI